MENEGNNPLLPECSQGELKPAVYNPNNLFSRMGSGVSEFWHNHQKGIVDFWMWGFPMLGILGAGATSALLKDEPVLRNIGIYGSAIIGGSYWWFLSLAIAAALVFDES